MDSFITFSKKRRSVRSYESTPVDREKLVRMIYAAQEAPVSCNLQVTKYIILDDITLLKRLSDIAGYKFTFAPAYILVLNDRRFTVERQSAVVGAGMAIQNMLLQALEDNLGTCAMAGFRHDAEIKHILNIPQYMDILLLISVGYPAKDKESELFPIEKLQIDELYAFNTYNRLNTINPVPHTLKDVLDYRRRITSVYLSRFRLNTYAQHAYENMFSFLSSFYERDALQKKKILDLISYDGTFIKKLVDNGIKENVIATDYLRHNLSFFEKALGVQTALISMQNQLEGVSNTSIDVITCAYQLPFLPDYTDVVHIAAQKIKVNGLYLVSMAQESAVKKIAHLGLRYLRRILGKPTNVYEGNPFYKIGKKYHHRNAVIVACIERYGFKKETVQIVKTGKWPLQTTFTQYAFRKIN